MDKKYVISLIWHEKEYLNKLNNQKQVAFARPAFD